MGLADRLKQIEQTSATPSAPPVPQVPLQQPAQYPAQPAQYPAQPAQYPTQPAQYPTQPAQYPAQPTTNVPQQPSQTYNKPPQSGLFSAISNKFTNAFQQNQPSPQLSPGPYYNAVKQRIDAVIQDKNLHHFYPINSPQYIALLNRVSHVDFPAIAAKRKIPLELAFDFAALAVVDIYFYLDDSGSIAFDEEWNPSSEKMDDLKLILSRVADIASMFDDDGMSIRFFNNSNTFDNIRSEKEAVDILSKIHYNGGTPMGKNLLTKILEPFVYAKARNNTFTKPVMVYIITDGVPDNKYEVKENIKTCKQWLTNTPYGKSAVNIMFAQVGSNQAAAQYLKGELDNDPDIGSDVDSTGNFELEYNKYKSKGVDLTPDLWLLQMTLGSLVRAYDEGND